MSGVTNAVYEASGRIFAQLWHVGRGSNPALAGTKLPVGPSSIAAAGHIPFTRPKKSYEEPHALTEAGIQDRVAAFRSAAVNAQRAGFEGVTIHGAKGYLLDQFLQDRSNHRSDRYGGSVENRTRFMLEVVDAAVSVWGAGRVSINLAPRSPSHDGGESDPTQTFRYVAHELGKRHLFGKYLGQIRFYRTSSRRSAAFVLSMMGSISTWLKKQWRLGQPMLLALIVSILRIRIWLRIRDGALLNTTNSETIYDIENPGSVGYNDYPCLNEKRFAGVVWPL